MKRIYGAKKMATERSTLVNQNGDVDLSAH
jgi:hypothetical protein